MSKKTVIFVDELNGYLVEKLRIDNSIIPLIIILKTIRYHLENRDLSFKSLYAEVKSSDLGTRIHITKLANKNWIQIEKSETDSRVKLIKPSIKMLDTFNAIPKRLRVI